MKPSPPCVAPDLHFAWASPAVAITGPESRRQEVLVATHLWHSAPHSQQTMAEVGSSAAHAALLRLGRLLFGGYFVYSGALHFVNHTQLAGYAALRGVPFPDFAVAFSGALILIGGFFVAAGLWTELGAGLIALFLSAVTPIMHAFWSDLSAPDRANDLVNFTKNIALLGGACLTAAMWRGREDSAAH